MKVPSEVKEVTPSDPGARTVSPVFRLPVFHKGTWGFSPGGGQTEKLYTGEEQKTHRGRPFQSSYRGWSVPTKKYGHSEVNLSLY